MDHNVSIQQLFSLHHKQLGLTWLEGKDQLVTLTRDQDENRDTPLVGYFNTIHPNQIQIIGQKELDHFRHLDKQGIPHALTPTEDSRKPVYIVAKQLKLPATVVQYARQHDIPLLSSTLSGKKLIEYLRYYLAQLTSEHLTRHGVFMEVMGIGVLITGSSGIGKSELALELLSRGHRLIADDAPVFTHTGPDILQGTCPDALHGFIEVRGLGVLNVRAMFGETAILHTKRLRLVINMELYAENEQFEINRLDTADHYENILDVDIPALNIPVAPGRNMAVIVEAAVRNHVLRLSGYNATEDFIKRQQQIMNKSDK